MEARELRIGNWVKQGRANVQVTGAMIQEINQELLDVEPIPLTEEWLLKFGFTKPNNWHCYKLVISDDKLQNLESSLQVSFEGCGFVQICRGGINAYSAKVKYVHQIQNLYFALTGQELTIKQS